MWDGRVLVTQLYQGEDTILREMEKTMYHKLMHNKQILEHDIATDFYCIERNR